MNTIEITPAQIFAHRGASGHAPENTRAAFVKAQALGTRFVEFDCMLSKDGHVVVHHDESLERTAGLAHRICDLELADLLHADVGAWFAPEFRGETVPTFIDTIALLGELNLGANVEIKPCSGHEEQTGKAVARALTTRWPTHLPPPIVSSFSEEALLSAIPLLRESDLTVECAILWDAVPADPIAEIKRLGVNAVHCDADVLLNNKDQIGGVSALFAWQATGHPLRAYTVNDPEDADALFAKGVSAIFTDFPDRFLRIP